MFGCYPRCRRLRCMDNIQDADHCDVWIASKMQTIEMCGCCLTLFLLFNWQRVSTPNIAFPPFFLTSFPFRVSFPPKQLMQGNQCYPLSFLRTLVKPVRQGNNEGCHASSVAHPLINANINYHPHPQTPPAHPTPRPPWPFNYHREAVCRWSPKGHQVAPNGRSKTGACLRSHLSVSHSSWDGVPVTALRNCEVEGWTRQYSSIDASTE